MFVPVRQIGRDRCGTARKATARTDRTECPTVARITGPRAGGTSHQCRKLHILSCGVCARISVEFHVFFVAFRRIRCKSFPTAPESAAVSIGLIRRRPEIGRPAMNGPEYLRREWWRSPRHPKILTTKLSGIGPTRRPNVTASTCSLTGMRSAGITGHPATGTVKG